MGRYRYKPRPNYLWSILSVAAVLSFIGLFLFFSLQSYELIDRIKGSFEIVVEFSPTATESDHDKVSDFLKSDSTTNSASVSFLDKETALTNLSGEMGVDLADVGDVNPLFDAILFQMQPSSSSSEAVEKLITDIRSLDAEVVGYHYQGGLLDKLVANLERLRLAFFAIGFILILLAIALIFNSIRLALYANRFLIKNMELVGASWNFIRAPFLRSGAKHGFISTIVCISILVGVFLIIRGYFPEATQYLDIEQLFILFAVLLLTGLVLNLASTFFVVTKYLRMQSRDLY